MQYMLSNNLNTNEIKDRAGVEVEFERLSQDERQTTFAKIGETPALPDRMAISHMETGSGTDLRRRSVLRFDLTVAGQVDTSKNARHSFYIVGDIPIGNITSYNTAKDCLARLLSFSSTTGVGTTVLFDCSGNGAAALVNGTL